MPRGDNPNSRKNLAKGKRFSGENARKQGAKGNATKKYNASFRAAGKELLTDEEMAKMWTAMINRAKSGNITAFKMLFDVMGEGAQDDVDKTAQLNIHIAPVMPPELPPDDIEEESDE